jgi:hypothetical protein
MEFQGLTKPPPEPLHTPPPMPVDWVIILGVTVGILLTTGIVLARRRPTQ